MQFSTFFLAANSITKFTVSNFQVVETTNLSVACTKFIISNFILNRFVFFLLQEDAKPLRECTFYYLLTHTCNKKYNTLVDIKKILTMHVSFPVDILLFILKTSLYKLSTSYKFSHFFNLFRVSPLDSISEDVVYGLK